MKTRIKLVAFGASIVEAVIGLSYEERWTTHLEKWLNENSESSEFCVINSGVGGNTSRECFARLEKDVISHCPDIVLVQLGGNDSTPDEGRAVSIEEFICNLEAIHKRLVDIEAEMILLTFTPIIDAWHKNGEHEKFVSFGGLDGYVERYRQATKNFAKEKCLNLIDIDMTLRKACDEFSPEKIILKDGVHLTAYANEIVAETIYNYLRNVKNEKD